jgi:arylsulfatase A-like enzyme
MMNIVLGITAAAALGQAAPEASRPNIVFLFTDDHAVQAIGAYGSEINETPNIDRIASDGVVFDRTYCANSICGPSRACILTGKHSHKNGFMANDNRFDASQFVFPAALQDAGYHTALIGKWHLYATPRGFDEWRVYPGQGNYYNPDYITAAGTNRLEGYSVELTTDLALDYLKRQSGGEKPFLLMCQYKAPHRQWLPGPDYLDLYNDVDIPEPDTLFDDYANRASPVAKHKMGIGEHLRMEADLMIPPSGTLDWERMTPEQQARWRESFEKQNAQVRPESMAGRDLVRMKYQRYIKNYLRCVAAVDDNIGRILDYLEESGLAENTIVVYSSDQGFYLGEHGWFDKRWMYEESFRMPLIVRWPGRTAPGTRTDALTQNIDFAPTFLEAAGVDIPADVQGESLVPLLKGNAPADWRDSLYYHYYHYPSVHHVARHYGVCTDRYKLIHYYNNDEWELFDLKTDPGEMKSIYGSPEYVQVQKQMLAELRELRAQYEVPENNCMPEGE